MSFLSVGLNLKNKSCAIIGGGKVGYRKALRLLEVGAILDVYSLNFIEEFSTLNDKQCTLTKENYFNTTKEYFLVIAATNDQNTNLKIAVEAQKRGSLVNQVDNKLTSDFVVKSDFRKNNLTISIGTDGLSPEFSRQLRIYIEDNFLNDWNEALELYQMIRQHVHLHIEDKKERIALLRSLDLESILFDLKKNSKEEVFERIVGCLLY